MREDRHTSRVAAFVALRAAGIEELHQYRDNSQADATINNA